MGTSNSKDKQVMYKKYGINISRLTNKVRNFRAGNVRHHYKEWRSLTSDKNILGIVRNGLKLNFQNDPLGKAAFEYSHAEAEFNIIDDEVDKLLSKCVITNTITDEEGEYFSNLFTRPKKDGTYRTILNLKFLNKECDTKHFKMESLKQAIHMIKPFSFLASIDIKDAFYSIPIHSQHKKYLKFMWNSSPMQFEAMPNGYKDCLLYTSPSPRDRTRSRMPSSA